MKPHVLLACLLAVPAMAEDPITIEAESFARQTLDEVRSWEVLKDEEGASGGAYIEALPDTRKTHGDKLIKGENFSDEPGKMAVLEYPIEVPEPGRYYVWARARSTGTEDNGLHFGLDGQWPDSGRRWQTVKKHDWHWDCKQRTQKVHIGVPMQLWLHIETPGKHTLMLSMREDGAEVDQILLAPSKTFRPEGFEPWPEATQVAARKPQFPKHWGKPPEIQTMDYRPLPGGYGFGSSTLAAWIQKNLDDDHANRPEDGDGSTTVSGELKQWHKVTLDLSGPQASERDEKPNPFTDLAFSVTFAHESGSPRYVVPGYFAADGRAGETGASSGTVWRAHLSPDKAGVWTYKIGFRRGPGTAIDGGGEALAPFDGQSGEFTVMESDKRGRDFRSKGRLSYVDKHHLRFAGTGEYFLKAGPDAPETLLAYTDFDGTTTHKPDKAPLKSWEPHRQDWKEGDPTWKDGKGKGLIGALNYLASKELNAFSFLTYNAGGDGDNIWPFVQRDAKRHYDCSKLDQWGVVFDHATSLGLYLHFKMQETEMDDDRGHKGESKDVPEALDGGQLGPERKLYCRELIARFGHALALNWNLGEENTQTTPDRVAMARYIRDTDPYDHHLVIHTFPNQQDEVYPPLLGDASPLTGASLQTPWHRVHQLTLKWLLASAEAGRPWVVANDEQNPAGLGVPQDIGYQGTDGVAFEKGKKKEEPTTGDIRSRPYTMHEVRKYTLWGNLMAGGAGVEYYFGYALPANDLVCEDWRSRDQSWEYCRIALGFFRDHQIPFQDMTNADGLVGNPDHENSKYALAKTGEVYLVYLPEGGTTELDLTGVNGSFEVRWFNPREGGPSVEGSVSRIEGGGRASLGSPPAEPSEDWLIMVKR